MRKSIQSLKKWMKKYDIFVLSKAEKGEENINDDEEENVLPEKITKIK